MLLSRRSFKTSITVFIVALLTGVPTLQAHDDSMPGKGKVPGHAELHAGAQPLTL